VPRFQETRIDLPALGFAVAVALGSGILVGLWPAWRVSKSGSLTLALHDSARGSSGGIQRQRARAGLVVTQVALAVMLLVAGGLTLKSFYRAQQAPLGFDPGNVLVMNIALATARYDNNAKITAFFDQLLARVSALPSVAAAAVGSNIPFDETDWQSSFHVTGTPIPPPGQEPSAEINVISNDYFRVMNMPILRGRGFDSSDVAGQPGSVIIDETFAKEYFPGADPIGRQIDDNQTPPGDRPPMTIVGVVARTRNDAPGESNLDQLGFKQMYVSMNQYPRAGISLTVRVTSGNPLALAPAVKHEVQMLDPNQPVASISTMGKNIATSLASRRLTMSLLGAFAALALVLASLGIYGVMALSTSQRTRELGIRLALGASRGDVFRLVLGQGLALIGIGLGAGFIGALAAGRLMNSLLYGVSSLDAAALFGALLTLSGVAFVACYIPARRATKVNPVTALRAE
jgi:putative ABC transport system permease protein